MYPQGGREGPGQFGHSVNHPMSGSHRPYMQQPHSMQDFHQQQQQQQRFQQPFQPYYHQQYPFHPQQYPQQLQFFPQQQPIQYQPPPYHYPQHSHPGSQTGCPSPPRIQSPPPATSSFARSRSRSQSPRRRRSRSRSRDRRRSNSSWLQRKRSRDEKKKSSCATAGSSKRRKVINFVTVVEKGHTKEKLNKRFETEEQADHGPFDCEENVEIRINRGPLHIELNDDEDFDVNYEFNPEKFKMLFPKKEYVNAIFDRDEIKAFHHDDILDEEVYVEKRTVSIKPKLGKCDDKLDNEIKIGPDQEGSRIEADMQDNRDQTGGHGIIGVRKSSRVSPPRSTVIEGIESKTEDHNPRVAPVEVSATKVISEEVSVTTIPDAAETDGAVDTSKDKKLVTKQVMDGVEAKAVEHISKFTTVEASTTKVISEEVSSTTIPDAAETDGTAHPSKDEQLVTKEDSNVWIIGDSLPYWAGVHAISSGKSNLNLPNLSIAWLGRPGLGWTGFREHIESQILSASPPSIIIIHLGGEDIVAKHKNPGTRNIMEKDICYLRDTFPSTKLIWMDILPRQVWGEIEESAFPCIHKKRKQLNRLGKRIVTKSGNSDIIRMEIDWKSEFFQIDGVHLNLSGLESYLDHIKEAINKHQ